MKESNKEKNIFSSKANALDFFQTKIRNSKIEEMYVFDHHEWKDYDTEILNRIQNIFSGKIVVRSSAIGEDSLEKSDAGRYKTILNLKVTQRNTIKNGINDVISSYNISEDNYEPYQILIQKQTTNSRTSGVIFTRTPDNGSPYYVINYEDGEKTNSITSGMIGNTIKIFRDISEKRIPKKWKKLIIAVKEIERLSKNDKLDIEFAITNKEIVIFQVRPLTMIKNFLEAKFSSKVNAEIKKNQKKMGKYKKIIFSNMTDWNPAEIIGDTPNRLDYSIYDFLIMKNSWSDGREVLGYYNPRCGLMKKFSGRAYVNVKASFESLLPLKLSKKLRDKLVKFFMYKLEKEPHLHDKVEFEILFTCYDFSLRNRMNELLDHGFTRKELKQISDILLTFTNELISITPKIQRDTKKSLKILEKNRKKYQKSADDYKIKLSIAENLLKKCRKFGAIQFSAVARLAFVARILLYGLVNVSNINKNDIERFMNSMSTPVTEFQNDLYQLKINKLKKENFLKKYGHLRPGTYDITINRYDKTPRFFDDLRILDTKKPIKRKLHNLEVKEILTKNGLIFQNIEFFSFVKETITLREESKFEFTRTLSDIIELIADAGKELGVSRSELSMLTLNDIFKFKTMKKAELKKFWKKQIKKYQMQREIEQYMHLPSILFSNNDFSIIQDYIAEPNFITNKKLISDTIFLKDLNNLKMIKNKIVMIDNADPGFDWIFTRDPSGLVTKYGGMASHMAIRCAELGLPAAIGCGETLFEKLKGSRKISMDCKKGDILILEYPQKDDFSDEKKLLKSLGYIK